MLRQIEIDAGELVGYKVFPGSQFVTSHAAEGQSDANWSGLYGQFNLQHAVAYLPNHFDRGHEVAMLVSIRTKKKIKCLLYKNADFSRTEVSSGDKAAALRHSIAALISGRGIELSNKPLLQSIGESLGSVVVMYDAEDLECAFPHCLVNDDNFEFNTLAVLARDPVNTWTVKSVRLGSAGSADCGGAALTLKKDERSDMRLLASRLEACLQPAPCSWIEQYTSCSPEPKSSTRRILCYGDSLTAGYYRYGSEFHPYGDAVEKLSNAKVDSVGMSGWTTDQMVQNAMCEKNEDVVGFEASGLNRLLQACKYDVVCLMAGTNDLGMDVSVEDITENISTMVKMCMLSSPQTQVAVLTVPPTGEESCSKHARSRRTAVNSFLAELVEAHPDRAVLVDGASILPNPGAHPRVATSESEAWDLDLLHLSPIGSDRLGQQVFITLETHGLVERRSN